MRRESERGPRWRPFYIDDGQRREGVTNAVECLNCNTSINLTHAAGDNYEKSYHWLASHRSADKIRTLEAQPKPCPFWVYIQHTSKLPISMLVTLTRPDNKETKKVNEKREATSKTTQALLEKISKDYAKLERLETFLEIRQGNTPLRLVFK